MCSKLFHKVLTSKLIRLFHSPTFLAKNFKIDFYYSSQIKEVGFNFVTLYLRFHIEGKYSGSIEKSRKI